MHRFYLSDEVKCSCGHEDETMDHTLFHCVNTIAQREVLKQQIGTWPTAKQVLIVKYQKQFSAFVESIDFESLQQGAQQL
jgi:hypothetical protein